MTSESALRKRVLVVEDEPDFAALLSSILMKAGYEVTTVFDGVSAMLRVHETRPDLITLDIQMPRKSGLHFYRQLKSHETYGDTPVVIVTGLTRDDRDMEILIRSFLEPENIPHPEAYVEKPVDEPRLLAAIQEALSASTSRAC